MKIMKKLCTSSISDAETTRPTFSKVVLSRHQARNFGNISKECGTTVRSKGSKTEKQKNDSQSDTEEEIYGEFGSSCGTFKGNKARENFVPKTSFSVNDFSNRKNITLEESFVEEKTIPLVKTSNKNHAKPSNCPQRVSRYSSMSSTSLFNKLCVAPEIPYKPQHLRPSLNGVTAPPIPPRVLNHDAAVQRRQLNEEYFENLFHDVHSISRHNDEFSEAIAASFKLNVENNTSQCTEHYYYAGSETKTFPMNFQNDVISDDSMSVQGQSKSQCDVYDGSSFKMTQKRCFGKAHFCSCLRDSATGLLHSVRNLNQCGWYWGNMTWQDAELMLNQCPNEVGLFLVRDSQDPLHILTVTVRTAENTIRHIRVEHTNGKFQLYDPDGNMNHEVAEYVCHPNIVVFLERAMRHSATGNFLYFCRPTNMGQAPVQIRFLYLIVLAKLLGSPLLLHVWKMKNPEI
ncbi:uncharacterized protein LOC143462315 isoform X2 [Clavelina lepadiformis]|uniref:uncharacterized protein LOC143462315 isoform X2 n=1 Tax=Clavelina lepadiformis TaxID=159417 RepID=UPI0040416027